VYKFISSFLFFFVFSILFQTRSYASEYFDRSYNVVYTVTENATTNVSIQVSLTNKTSDYYASADTIEVGFPSVTNVKVTDPDGPITPRVVKTDTGNQIEINFNKKVVGKDNTLVFTVVFDTSDIARHDGNVWEINIPGISDPAEFKDFKTEVKVPSSLGAPTYIKPVQKDNSLVFTKEQLGKSGISLAFGEEQLYSFDLDYHLRNSNVFPIRTEIALPPSTNYQEVAIESIEPKPENVRIDEDGNWLALYILTPTQKVDVRVRGKVSISKEPLVKEPLPRSEYGTYLKEQPYWQVSNADIKKLAAELKTPRAIYDYVVKTLEYDFERVARNDPRKGALKTLQDPKSSVCLEFTDLFIALSRAAGIPAREVNGYAFTENPQQRPLSLVKDILHAWPEYYDEQKGTWIMVDPTWGNTTGGTDYFDVFDFDHIVFVRKGFDSQYPVPAGGYKYDGDENKKDIRVSFAKSFPTADALLQVQPQFPSNQLSALPISGSVTVQNVSSRMSKPSSILVTSQNLQPLQQSLSLPAIPPYGIHTAQVSFKKTPFLSNDVYSFTIKLGQTIIKRSVAVTPYSFTKAQLIGGIGIVVLTICILIIATKARSVRIFR
jgi:transglutaminase-like putative cysteine protease